MLHTGVYYTPSEVVSFCSISESRRHDPSAVWAHLHPVLSDIRKSRENVSTVHFVSDGPTTQYRNKTNFYLASVIPKTMGFANVMWNFLEAGHGKGPADGMVLLNDTQINFVLKGRIYLTHPHCTGCSSLTLQSNST